jgi:hypothetical protein
MYISQCICWYNKTVIIIVCGANQFIKPQKYVVFLQAKAIGETNRGDEFRHSPHIQSIIVSYNLFLNQTVIFMYLLLCQNNIFFYAKNIGTWYIFYNQLIFNTYDGNNCFIIPKNILRKNA